MQIWKEKLTSEYEQNCARAAVGRLAAAVHDSQQRQPPRATRKRDIGDDDPASSSTALWGRTYCLYRFGDSRGYLGGGYLNAHRFCADDGFGRLPVRWIPLRRPTRNLSSLVRFYSEKLDLQTVYVKIQKGANFHFL